MTTTTETTFAAISTDSRTTAGRRRRRAPVFTAAALAAAAALSAAAGTARAQSYQPITLTGWDQDLVVESLTAGTTTTAFDLPNNYAFYVAGLNSSGGLPASGTINSVANPATTFQMQPYTGDNALFVNTQATSGTNTFNVTTTGALTLGTSKSYTSLAFLSASANSGTSNVFSYTLNYAGGNSSTGTFATQDWYSGTGYAVAGLGRINPTSLAFDTSGVSGLNPRLYETDVAVPTAYVNDPLTGIQITNFTSTKNGAGGTSAAIFAVSGLQTANTNVWAGTVSNAWDTSTPNFTGNTSGGTVFSNGNLAVFNDTAATSNVTIQSAGVLPYQTALNNKALAYTFSGGGINAGTVAVSGGGSVTFNNANAYTGATTITNASTVNVGTGGSLAGTSSLNIGTGSTVNVAAGGLVDASALNLPGGATLNLAGTAVAPTTTAVTYNVSGSLNLAPGGLFSGNGSTTIQVPAGGSLNVAAGATVSVQALTGLYVAPGTSFTLPGTLNSNSTGYVYAGTAQTTGLPASFTIPAGGVYNSNAATAFVYAYNASTFTVAPGGTYSGNGSTAYMYNGAAFNLLGTWSVRNASSSSGYGTAYIYGNTSTFTVAAAATVPQLYLGYSTFAGTATLNNSSDTLYYLNGSNAGSRLILNGANGTAVTLGSGVANTGTFVGTISGTGSLNVNLNASTGTLTGTNTYTGGTTFTSGYVNVFSSANNNNTGALSTGPFTFNGGGIGISNTTSTPVTFNNAVGFGPNPTAVFFGQGLVALSSTLTLAPTGTTTFNVSTSTAALAKTNPLTLNLGGSLTGSAGSTLGVAGGANAGVLNLNQSLSITGLSAAGGVLNVNVPQALSGNVTATAGTINLNAALSYSGQTNASGGTVVVNTLAGLGSTSALIAGPSAVANAAAGTLVLQDPSTSTYGYVGGGGTSGTPLPVTLLGGGTLQVGATGQNASYVAPIAVGVGGGIVSAPAAGTLTLSAPITTADAVGPVGLTAPLNTANTAANINLAAANNYAGETQITSPGNANVNYLQVQLQAAGALSPNAGVNLLGGGQIVLDLNGYNSTVAYLAGGTPVTQLVETSTGSPTLTLGNASVPATSAKTFAGTLAGNLSLVKVGAGTQALTAANTYAGTTAINGGTLAVGNAQALSNGGVFLGGGTLQLGGTGGNLAGFGGFTLNGGATVTNNVLNLATNGLANTARSAYFALPEPVNAAVGFTAGFLYTPAAGTADGITFLIQNDPRGSTATGGYGNGLGYTNTNGGTPVNNSVAVGIDLFNNELAFGTNGTLTETSADPGNVYVFTSDPLQVNLAYNGVAHTLTETVTDTAETGLAPNNVETTTYNLNLATALGSGAGYVGFTGGTGQSSATINVSNFTFTNGGFSAPVGIGNTVTTTANTTSFISSTVSPADTTVAIGNLTLSAGSKLGLQYNGSGTTSRMVLTTPSLTIAPNAAGTGPGAQLDLGTADLVVQNAGGNLAALTAYVAAGYANGTFNGSGIVSSAARANAARNTTVGVIVNNDPSAGQLYGSGTARGLFDGANPGSNDVLVKYTYFGDANLDGKVDGSDYAQIDAGFLSNGTLTGWYYGDFNYDGKVDASDYTLIDNAFNTQAASLASAVTPAESGISAASTDEIAPVGPTAVVPEPATLALTTVAAAGLLGRRRRA